MRRLQICTRGRLAAATTLSRLNHHILQTSPSTNVLAASREVFTSLNRCSREAAMMRRHGVYNNESDVSQVESSLRLSAPAGNPPPLPSAPPLEPIRVPPESPYPSNISLHERPRGFARGLYQLEQMLARSRDDAKAWGLQQRKRRQPSGVFPASQRPCGKPSPTPPPRLRASASPLA